MHRISHCFRLLQQRSQKVPFDKMLRDFREIHDNCCVNMPSIFYSCLCTVYTVFSHYKYSTWKLQLACFFSPISDTYLIFFMQCEQYNSIFFKFDLGLFMYVNRTWMWCVHCINAHLHTSDLYVIKSQNVLGRMLTIHQSAKSLRVRDLSLFDFNWNPLETWSIKLSCGYSSNLTMETYLQNISTSSHIVTLALWDDKIIPEAWEHISAITVPCDGV